MKMFMKLSSKEHLDDRSKELLEKLGVVMSIGSTLVTNALEITVEPYKIYKSFILDPLAITNAP
jgi:hypothetical protein